VSKTFTTLLLQDMVERGVTKLEDPVAKYLPKTVTMPTRSGREITLLDLATQTSGLPWDPDNMSGKDTKEQFETYTFEKMYAFLSSYKLPRDPGKTFGYSNVGMALLGHAIALKDGADFETLLVDRIGRRLHMDSTCITLTPELRPRLAMAHDKTGKSTIPWKMEVYAPAGAILSSANDLLKYVGAQAGLTTAPLTKLMERTHVIRFEDVGGGFGHTAMPWIDRDAFQPPGMDLLGHAGGNGGYHAFVGFDMKQRRGVVVLTTFNDISAEAIGWTLLQRLPLNQESAKQFARYQVGIGVALDLDQKLRALRITKVYPDSPAAQAGLKSGMVIKKVGAVSVEGKSLAESTDLLRGNGGTKVELQLVDGNGKTTLIEVARKRFLMRPTT
jgi:CubicO group peptidase (beta-lactamase class C family)